MPWLVLAAVLYLIGPGHPDVILRGLPIGQTGTSIVVLLIVGAIWTRDVGTVKARPWMLRLLGIAIAAKLLLAVAAPLSGWLADSFTNDRFEGPSRQSIDFMGLGATRIDRQLSFDDTEQPSHFFNDFNFNFGVRRE